MTSHVQRGARVDAVDAHGPEQGVRPDGASGSAASAGGIGAFTIGLIWLSR